jgi:predicted AAA+ superfamily ATPase
VLNFHNTTLNWLPNTVAELPPSIEKIEIFVEAGDLSRNESTTTWPELDCTLAGTTFSALRNVTMAVLDSRDNKMHRQQMWKLLPLCARSTSLH